jgi:alpha-beta hydrolase superfamily lysophospholipase
MAEIIAGGIRFHVQRLPAHDATRSRNDSTDPPTIVFVHGLIADNMAGFYYTLANPAARAGADVILYDLRGHGSTERQVPVTHSQPSCTIWSRSSMCLA